MITAQEYYESIKKTPPISSGDATLDLLLHGGFIPGPIYLLSGASGLLSSLLMRTAVNALAPRVDGGAEYQNIAYVDGENTFNPYFISKCATAKQLNPTYVLDHIVVARTFTWNQMVEVVEEKIAGLPHVDMVLISGLTSMFEETANDTSRAPPVPKFMRPSRPLNWKAFQDLNRMIAGIKKVIKQSDPIIVITGPFNSRSRTRPAGGQIIAHFGGILVGIEDEDRYYDYTLYQHPFLPFHSERVWKVAQMQGNTRAKRLLLKDPHNLTLDSFFKS
jgi:hypothetical protein